jgi:hypothetical protein
MITKMKIKKTKLNNLTRNYNKNNNIKKLTQSDKIMIKNATKTTN